MKRFLFLLALFVYVNLFSGFEAETLVCTDQRLVKIDELSAGDHLVQLSAQGLSQCKVVSTKKCFKKEAVTIVVGGERVTVFAKQMFYLADQQRWKKAKLLKSGDCLQTVSGFVQVDDVIFHNQKIEMYDLLVDGNHTFCITQYGIVVHNWFIGLSLAFAFGGGSIEFTGISVSIAALGVWFTKKIHNWRNHKKGNGVSIERESCGSCSGGGAPDPNDDDEKKKEYQIDLSKDDIPHMFKDKPGHLPDTVKNRKRILDLVNDMKNRVLKGDINGKDWYAKIVEDGKQLWAYVRNGSIRNAGMNDVPRPCHPQTGLSRPFKPSK